MEHLGADVNTADVYDGCVVMGFAGVSVSDGFCVVVSCSHSVSESTATSRDRDSTRASRLSPVRSTRFVAMVSSSFSVSHATRVRLNSLGKKLQKVELRAKKEMVKKFLNEHEELVEPTLLLLESGLVQDLVNQTLMKKIPACATKLSLTPVGIQERLVKGWSNMTPELLKSVRKSSSENVLEKLFLFAIRKKGTDKLWEHDEATFIKDCQTVAVALHEPLKNVVVTDDGIVDWSACGAFAWARDGTDEGGYTHVMHRATGRKAPCDSLPRPPQPPFRRSHSGFRVWGLGLKV